MPNKFKHLNLDTELFSIKTVLNDFKHHWFSPSSCHARWLHLPPGNRTHSGIFLGHCSYNTLRQVSHSSRTSGGLADREQPAAHRERRNSQISVPFSAVYLPSQQWGNPGRMDHNQLCSLPKSLLCVLDHTHLMCKSISPTDKLALFQPSTLQVISSLSLQFSEVITVTDLLHGGHKWCPKIPDSYNKEPFKETTRIVSTPRHIWTKGFLPALWWRCVLRQNSNLLRQKASKNGLIFCNAHKDHSL